MKILNRTIIIISFLIFGINNSALSQPHPNSGKVPGDAGTNNTPVGGGAPVGSGDIIIIVLAVAYSGRKIYHLQAVDDARKD